MLYSQQPTTIKIPLFLSPVSAGFPSPADDYRDKSLDLNQYLIKHPAATIFIRVNDDSMLKAGIFCGDLLIVDRSLKPSDKKVVIALCDGSMMARRLRKIKGKTYLMPENPGYRPIEVCEGMDIEIVGVATTVIHSV